jgi:hypothetical protein
MPRRLWLLACLAILCDGCDSADPPAADTPPANAARRETVFDPMVGTIDRAKGVRTTVDDQAAELRRRVEQAER